MNTVETDSTSYYVTAFNKLVQVLCFVKFHITIRKPTCFLIIRNRSNTNLIKIRVFFIAYVYYNVCKCSKNLKIYEV